MRFKVRPGFSSSVFDQIQHSSDTSGLLRRAAMACLYSPSYQGSLIAIMALPAAKRSRAARLQRSCPSSANISRIMIGW